MLKVLESMYYGAIHALKNLSLMWSRAARDLDRRQWRGKTTTKNHFRFIAL